MGAKGGSASEALDALGDCSPYHKRDAPATAAPENLHPYYTRRRVREVGRGGRKGRYQRKIMGRLSFDRRLFAILPAVRRAEFLIKEVYKISLNFKMRVDFSSPYDII